MKLERKTELDDMARDIYRATETLQRGDTIPNDLILKVVGGKPHQGSWGSVVERLKRLYEQRREITLWPVHGVGLRLMTVDDQIGLQTQKRQQRAGRQLRKAAASVEALVGTQLTDGQANRRAVMGLHLHSLQRELRQRMQQQKALDKPTDTLPRRQLEK